MAERTNKPDVEAIFSAALEKKTPVERAAFLEEACAGDTALRSRVEALVAAHAEVGSFLSRSTVDNSAGAISEGPGARIGRYKLLQLIGEGGFGLVYMAEQDEPVRRKVALKIIKLGMDTKQVIARFESERQALALMDHPNIAKVLDAGATETGRPYFVMELVRGITFTEYCDQNNLSPEERLELFIPICNAVQHAHQKGIIHRDIKPSNVMITLHDGKPVPKVIDFGVAKATHQRLTEKTLFTEYHQFIGTPAYMSPEQAEMSGLDVDTRSDIYSLGVLLYEILTGTTPFDATALREAGFAEITRIIREEEPETPSTRLEHLGEGLSRIARQRSSDPGALCKLMRGDLDWIVMKSMEKDRTRRYETANALASDIERHLGSEPVLAGPPSSLYRCVKFVRRHRTWVAAGSMVAAALFFGLALATVALLHARRERDAAENARAMAEMEAERSRAIIESLKETLLSVAPSRISELEIDAQSVLAVARDVVSDATPMPISFGKYADLDVFRAANWLDMAEASEKISDLLMQLMGQLGSGSPLDPHLQEGVRQENTKLARMAVGLMGQIPTNCPVNGEYSHPLTLINIMAARLVRSGKPLNESQKARIEAVGNEYEVEYDRRSAGYTAQTLWLEKLVDEIELKRKCMDRMLAIFTPEQRGVVIPGPELQHRMVVDVLSPAVVLQLLVKKRDFNSPEGARTHFPLGITNKYGLSTRQQEALEPAFDRWYEEVSSILKPVEVESKHLPLHLDEVIVAGRALTHVLEDVINLPDLDEKTRAEILNDPSLRVPRIVQRPIEEVKASIESLRRSAGPHDRQLADELDILAKIHVELGETELAIPALVEIIEICGKIPGELLDVNPFRYRLRNIIWELALGANGTSQTYAVAERAAEVVLSLKPDSAASYRTLGGLQYRLGEYDKSLESLRRAEELMSTKYAGDHPGIIGFMAMTHYRLGRREEAREGLVRLREMMQSRQHSENVENQRILSEAEGLFEEEGAEPSSSAR